ncbi:MAG: hypothetical protein KAG19_04975 [Methylococcales bacterium]|nr:hypothetical protein [Methylococcales bacterium]
MNPIRNFSVALILLLFVSACGYHLKGSKLFPKEFSAVYLDSGSVQLRKSFKRILKYADGELVDSVEDGNSVIKIFNEKMDSRLLSLNNAGRVNEVELIYSLEFIVLNKKGNVLLEKQSLEIRRDYFNNQGDVLGSNNEDRVIRDEMYDQAVATIAQRMLPLVVKK